MSVLKNIFSKNNEQKPLSDHHIVIIGNGIAGITAARNIRKHTDYQITVISAETEYFYSRTALMYLYMGQMQLKHTEPYERNFWQKNRINLIFDKAESIDIQKQTIYLSKCNPIKYSQLILATGSKPRLPDWAKKEMKGLHALYSIQDLEKIEIATKSSKKAVLVGGGLIGIEMAEMLRSRQIEVTIIIRESTYWGNVLPTAEGKIVEKEIEKHGIKLIKNEQVKRVVHENEAIKYVETETGKLFETNFIGVCIGVQPNLEFLQNTDLQINNGILVNEYLETNTDNIYAIGDCVEHINPPVGRKPIEQIWYTGKSMGETVAKTIAGQKTKYEPGIFYNSAKFFELDYSVYGQVPNTPTDSFDSFYWQNDKMTKCIRIVYEKENEIVVGIHALGMRLRQTECMEWLKNKVPLNAVKKQLKNLNFEPEFTKNEFSQIPI